MVHEGDGVEGDERARVEREWNKQFQKFMPGRRVNLADIVAFEME